MPLDTSSKIHYRQLKYTLRKKIEDLHLRQATSVKYLTNDSHTALVKTLKNRIKKLETENTEARGADLRAI